MSPLLLYRAVRSALYSHRLAQHDPASVYPRDYYRPADRQSICRLRQERYR